MDIEKDSTNSHKKQQRELAELSERVINNVWEDVEELPTVFESRHAERQNSQSQGEIEQPLKHEDVKSDQAEEQVTKNASDQLEQPVFQVFDRAAFQQLHEKSSSQEKEIRVIIKQLDESDGGTRPLRVVTKEIHDEIAKLEGRYPNMHPFTRFVAKQLALCEHNPHKEIYIPPLLLVSKPGQGKTACVKELAAILGVPFDYVDYSTSSAAWILVGVSSVWSSAKPGLIFERLVKNPKNPANFLVLCDEIDKSLSSSSDKYPPINVFYKLLEKDMMRSFQDEYLPQLSLDASRAMFIATANSTESIPEAILSRFHVIRIDTPSLDQLRVIAKSIYRSIIASEAFTVFSEMLKEDIIESLLGFSPRQIKVILKLALANASYRYRQNKLESKQINLETEDLDFPESEVEERKIGFVWN